MGVSVRVTAVSWREIGERTAGEARVASAARDLTGAAAAAGVLQVVRRRREIKWSSHYCHSLIMYSVIYVDMK